MHQLRRCGNHQNGCPVILRLKVGGKRNASLANHFMKCYAGDCTNVTGSNHREVVHCVWEDAVIRHVPQKILNLRTDWTRCAKPAIIGGIDLEPVANWSLKILDLDGCNWEGANLLSKQYLQAMGRLPPELPCQHGDSLNVQKIYRLQK